MAESFFTDQVLVETPLKTEFYKHLPGILTGIGIIGTFSGLITGLSNFQVSTNADQVRQSLASLIQNVGHAFFVSGSAICLAMIFTWVEKSLVTKRFRQVEELCLLIDSFFDAGAGEEYLARLVHASETSATQAAQIKDALVADLKEILTEMTRQQIAAAATNSQQLSDSMARTFTESLKDPITRISEAVDRVSGNQGDAVNKMLTDVLSGFSAQMKDMFGGQLQGMNEVLLKTSESIQMAAGKFDQLATNMESAGQGAVEKMADRIDLMTASMESRQDGLNDRMTEFVEQIRQSVKDSQSESKASLRSMMDDLASKTSGLIVSLQEQGIEAANAHAKQQAQFSQQSESVLSQISKDMESLTVAVNSASQAMEAAVGQLATTTRNTVDKMNAGAGTLNTAVGNLAQSLDGMRQVTAGIVVSSDKLAKASGGMVDVTRAVSEVMEQYRGTRDSFAAIVDSLNGVIESARKEASMTSEIVARISSATDKLGLAQKGAEEYLDGVSTVLAEVHRSFGENIEKTLRQANAQFHKELSEAVNRLKGAIQDLGDTLDGLSPREL